MDELRALETRLEKALSVLEQADGATGAGNAGRLAELEAENRALSERLEQVTGEREKDLAQLDTLIARLRPLIEETA
ncbi:hypothetical protein GE300_05205 [Rhodobacteraceae bacterium 2CG4]|uniref:Uncharacterized protein n=1 Tax=Halovulum marinum TaxID=2662447 RepID=A0A6L5YXG0_9RHOB|nr:hypothetical protein [Halovulum marinum]MSU89023.1 hypothetical protein [Halovulum marinum]